MDLSSGILYFPAVSAAMMKSTIDSTPNSLPSFGAATGACWCKAHPTQQRCHNQQEQQWYQPRERHLPRVCRGKEQANQPWRDHHSHNGQHNQQPGGEDTVALRNTGALQGEEPTRSEREHQDAGPHLQREVEHAREDDTQHRDHDEGGQQSISHQADVSQHRHNLPVGRFERDREL